MLTDEESRELLTVVRFLKERAESTFIDFKMDEIPKRKKANLPGVLDLDESKLNRINSLLDWWDDLLKNQSAKTKKTKYIVPMINTAISPIIGGVLIVVILKVLGL